MRGVSDINATDFSGNTALIRAARNGSPELVKLLLVAVKDAGADIN